MKYPLIEEILNDPRFMLDGSEDSPYTVEPLTAGSCTVIAD